MKPLRHCFFIQSAAAVLLATMIHRISADDAELTRLRSLNTGSIYSTGSNKIPDSYIVLLDDDTPAEDVQLVANSLLPAYVGGNSSNPVRDENLITHIGKGFTTTMTEQEALSLSTDPQVKVRVY